MESIFLKILNMSLTASWLIVVVILLRIVMKKVPKYIHCILWGMVAIKLVCPISFESMWSFVPSREPISTDILYEPNIPPIQSDIPVINEVVNEVITPIIYDTFTPSVDMGEAVVPSQNPMQLFLQWSCIVWLIGIAVMIVINVITYVRIYYEVKCSMRLRENIWLCDNIDTPFVLGIFRPQIYLPSNIGEEQIDHVVAHEKAHIKRHDHWWKPIGFLILSIYWFNPFVWIAYILLCRDIELACDERVVKTMGVEEKKAYSETLLACSISRHMVMACPLAFGEVGVKMRIQSVLNYKKPSFWVMIVAIVTCMVVAIGFLTNQKTKEEKAIGDLFPDMNKVTINYMKNPEWIVDENGSGSFEIDSDNIKLTDVPEKQEKIKQILDKYYYYVDTAKESTSRDYDGGITSVMISYGDTKEEHVLVHVVDAEDEIYIDIVSENIEHVYELKGKGSASNMTQEILTVLKSENTVDETPQGAYMLSKLYYSRSGGQVVYVEASPYYQIVNYPSGQFALQNYVAKENQWNLVGGAMSEIVLTEENFDDCFESGHLWAKHYDAAKIRKENEMAWQVDFADGIERRYILLKQKNGDFLLAHVFCEDSARIIWLYELEELLLDGENKPSNPEWDSVVSEEIDATPTSYEEAKQLIANTNELLFGYDTDRQEGLEDTCKEIEEVLTVYFKCFFNPSLWRNYTFVEDSVLARWKHLYESAFGESVSGTEKSSVSIRYVYYHDADNYFMEVLHNGNIRNIHLKKIGNQWHIVEDIQGSSDGGYYSEEEKIDAMSMKMEALQLGRNKNPLTKDLLQQGYDVATQVYQADVYGLTAEEFEQVKQQLEVTYDAQWCDQLLVQCIGSYNGYVPKFEEGTTFMVWIQPKENYDESVAELLDGIFGTEEHRGDYVIVTYGAGGTDNWKTQNVVFVELPAYTHNKEIVESIKVEDVCGKRYTYQNEGFGIGFDNKFTIDIHKDGTFSYYEGNLSSHFGHGTWKIDGSIITLTEPTGGVIPMGTVNHFYFKEGNLVFIEEDSSQFLYIRDIKDGELFYGDRDKYLESYEND